MIVYSATKQGFLSDVMTNSIADIILEAYRKVTGHSTSAKEIDSWRNSMMYMSNVMQDENIPADVGVAIEYHIPQSSKRIDFIVSGKNHESQDAAILVELKQWTEATTTDKDGVIVTYLGGGERETAHPSYQAWTYACLLRDFNQTVDDENVQLHPCAYLHNYDQPDIVTNNFYKEYLDKAPVFLKSDAIKLRDFIKSHVKYGDNDKLMYRIDHGKIRPSKNLADQLESMLKGNQEFIMIDDQKIVYETALKQAQNLSTDKRQVFIVGGGPGTGKSVVAINLLVELTKRGLMAQYVSKNAAPRDVYESKLTGSFRKSHISNLFSGSGSFTESAEHLFDVLIVDEAHRLNAKSGMYQNKGENQIKELIYSSKLAVFFIDEDQRVTLRDIGEKEQIRKWAKHYGAEVIEQDLTSQFRCNGSDGYLAWLDNTLQIRQTANETLESIDYDFRVLDSPTELRDLIYEKNKINNKSRLVAGYCWNWVSKRQPNKPDIVMDDFSAQWNLANHGNLWIVKPESVSEVGCIHTCQGLELDYIGVIIGPDLIVRNGKIVTDPSKRASTDKSLHGFKKLEAEDSKLAEEVADSIIKNTYRTLMTRGAKGCYIYCTDQETQEYFKNRIEGTNV